jgi:hypothetical protein
VKTYPTIGEVEDNLEHTGRRDQTHAKVTRTENNITTVRQLEEGLSDNVHGLDRQKEVFGRTEALRSTSDLIAPRLFDHIGSITSIKERTAIRNTIAKNLRKEAQK